MAQPPPYRAGTGAGADGLLRRQDKTRQDKKKNKEMGVKLCENNKKCGKMTIFTSDSE